jgi:hypothetical protein
MFGLSKQVTHIENQENMILFHEEFAATVCIVTRTAQWHSRCQHPATIGKYQANLSPQLP